MHIKPFQLKADSAVGKTKNVRSLLLGLEPQIIAERLLGALYRTRIEIYDILRNFVAPNLRLVAHLTNRRIIHINET